MLPVSAIVDTIVDAGGPREGVAAFAFNIVAIFFTLSFVTSSCVVILAIISLGSPPRQIAGVGGAAAATGVAAAADVRWRTLRTCT